jgi:outer membrane protein OmpA-like peptidoglycan-associated protein/tetratricopeptide (TPR) repeat protein
MRYLIPVDLIVFSLICVTSFAQSEDPLSLANRYFQQGDFREALPYYNQIEKIERSGPLLFKRAVCHYETNQLERARVGLSRAWELGYQNDQIDFYMGRIFHHQGNFADAAVYYKSYLSKLPSYSPDREPIRHLISQCGHALNLAYKKPLALIERPEDINTVKDEYGIIESPHFSDKFYFTSEAKKRGEDELGQLDIYSTSLNNTQWSLPEALSDDINTEKPELLTGFTEDGMGMYFVRMEKNRGVLTLNVNQENGNSIQQEIPLRLNSSFPDVFVFNESVLLFTTDALGGEGGLDLFYSIHTSDGWTKPKNFGFPINTKFDEVSPSMSRDGMTLFFSSDRDESIGGFDVFKSRFLSEAGKWSSPENMGIPINSPGDEKMFRLSRNGLMAFLVSDRKNAIGGFDNYIARFKEKEYGQLIQVDRPQFVGENIEIISLYEYDPDQNIIFSDQTIDSELSTDISPNTLVLVQDGGVREFVYAPIYYSDGQNVLSDVNKSALYRILELLKEDDDIKLEVICSAHFEAEMEYNLFLSQKVGELVKGFFIDLGVKSQRVQVKGLGDSYPIVKENRFDGHRGDLAGYNSRVDFKFHIPVDQNIQVVREDPDLPASAKDIRYDLYETIIQDEATFKLQIALVNRLYQGAVLSSFNDVAIEEHAETGLYAYTIGLYDNYSDALRTKRVLEREGFADVTIVPYVDGIRIEMEDIVHFVNQHPDLKNIINYGD